MIRTFTTRKGDVLDQIVHSVYGRADGPLETVLEANRGLADFGPILPPGIVIALPEITEPAVSIPLTRLWE